MKIFDVLIPVLVSIAISTVFLSKKSDKGGKVVSSVMLFVVTAALVFVYSSHMCDQGYAPPFIIIGTSLLASVVPWFLIQRPWILRGILVMIIVSGIYVASFLTDSYHQDTITGNSNYASGRFWHTFFTGQYPRKNRIERH